MTNVDPGTKPNYMQYAHRQMQGWPLPLQSSQKEEMIGLWYNSVLFAGG